MKREQRASRSSSSRIKGRIEMAVKAGGVITKVGEGEEE